MTDIDYAAKREKERTIYNAKQGIRYHSRQLILLQPLDECPYRTLLIEDHERYIKELQLKLFALTGRHYTYRPSTVENDGRKGIPAVLDILPQRRTRYRSGNKLSDMRTVLSRGYRERCWPKDETGVPQNPRLFARPMTDEEAGVELIAQTTAED